jgi:hypothetical protein
MIGSTFQGDSPPSSWPIVLTNATANGTANGTANAISTVYFWQRAPLSPPPAVFRHDPSLASPKLSMPFHGPRPQSGRDDDH